MKKSLLSTFWVLLFVIVCAAIASYEQDSITPSTQFPGFLALLMPVPCLLLLLWPRKNAKSPKVGPVVVELSIVGSVRNIKRRWLLLVFIALCGVTAFDLWWLGFPAASMLGFVFILVWLINKDLSELACTIISGCVAGLLVAFCAMTQVRVLDSDQLMNAAKQIAVPPEQLALQNESIQKYLKKDTIYPKTPDEAPYVPDSAHAVKWKNGRIKVFRRYIMRLDSLYDENLFR